MATYSSGDWESRKQQERIKYLEKYDWQKTPTTKSADSVTINSLYPQFYRWAIGFDPLFNAFKQTSTINRSSGYPPYNIYQDGDDYTLELAVAGFGREDITIEVQELTMTVHGRLAPSETEPVHKGIATRDFKQDFVLAEYVVVKGAELKDGLLRIYLEKQVPEEKKTKIIEIS